MPRHYAEKAIRIFLLAAALLLCVLFASGSQSASSSVLGVSKPTVVLQASKTSITIPCPPGSRSASNSCPTDIDLQIRLASTARDFGKQPLHAYTVGAGRILGEGSNVVWDLSGVWPGIYTASVEVRDNKKRRAVSSVTVKLTHCMDCLICDGLCPQVRVVCYDEVKAGTPITCKVVMTPPSDAITYNWTARSSGGADLSATLTSRNTYVSIPSGGLANQTVHATVEIKGIDPTCSGTSSGSTKVKP